MQALMVTTAHRGVFFGYGEPASGDTICLERARMCIYWPTTNKGVLGLAADGPAQGSKIGPAVPNIWLRDVTAVVAVAPEAAKRWESAPWS